MEYWYGLTPEANRETSEGLIDIRTLPDYEATKARIEGFRATDKKPERRHASTIERQFREIHALTFAAAVHAGYDFEAHIKRENERYEREAQEHRDQVAAHIAAGTWFTYIDEDGNEQELPF